MRTINKYFYLLAAVALAGVVSCQKEVEEFTPGEPDSETCEGVYFIKQDVIEDTQIFDPTQQKVDTIIVRRSNSAGSLTVKPTVGLSEITADGPVDGDASLFKVSDIVFKDGQEESFVVVEFPNVKEGVQYSLHLSIDGDEYSSKYSSSLKTCDYKVLCVAYVDFCIPGTEEDEHPTPALVTFKFGWWSETRTAYIKYYEVDGVRHCSTYGEKLAPDTKTNGAHEEKGGFWGVDPNQHLEFLWFQADVEECSDCGDPHPYVVPAGYPNEGGELMTFVEYQHFQLFDGQPETYVVDYYGYQRMGGYARPYLHFVDANSIFDMASYYDGNGGFYFWILGYNTISNRGSGWAFPQDYDIVGIAEGFTRADFTLEMTAGMPEPDESGENVVPIDFEVGPDVVWVGYSILEGKATSAAIAKEAATIAKDTTAIIQEIKDGVTYEKYATWVHAEGTDFSDMIAPEDANTGIYTLVAVAIDTVQVRDKGQIKKVLYEARTTSSVNFKYLVAGDAGQVVLNVAAASTANLASQGYSPETSFQYTIKGAGITGAIPMVYSQAEIESNGGIDAVVDAILAEPNTYYSLLSDDEFEGKLSAEQLASVNDLGFTDICTAGISPGTMFYIIVWATNGYDVAVEYATTTTAGDPLPVYMPYTVDSVNPEYMLESASDWMGTWNIYGVDAYGSSSLRSYLGKSVIAASDTPTEGPDQKGLYDEYVTVTGLFGSWDWLAQYGITNFDDRLEMDVYGGAMYTCSNVLYNDNIFEDCTVYYYSKSLNDWGYDYLTYFFSCFLPVRDGYYALIDVTDYGYDFVGLGIASEENGWLAKVYDQLLVDPAKDDNGLANAPALHKAISRAKADFSNCVLKAGQLGLTGKQMMHQAIDEYMKGYRVRNHFITIEGVKGLAPIQTVRKVEARHNISITDRQTVKDGNTSTVQFSTRKHMK